MRPLLSISSLIAGYGKLPILHEVSLDLDAGKMLAIVGPNGAGKTTLTRAIVHQCNIQSGRIEFDNSDITGLPSQRIARLGIGYVPQTDGVFRSLTVDENLQMSSLLLDRTAQKHAMAKAYELFPRLTERRQQLASSLSGGERQMLAISSALLNNPRLLILDEPVSGLSPSMTDEVARSISEINRLGVTVIWVAEENPQQIIRLSDEVIVMSTGTVRMRQKARDLLDTDHFREIFLGI